MVLTSAVSDLADVARVIPRVLWPAMAPPSALTFMKLRVAPEISGMSADPHATGCFKGYPLVMTNIAIENDHL